MKNWHVGPLNVRVLFASGTFFSKGTIKVPRWTESWHSRPVQKLDRSSLVCQDKLLILTENIFRAEFRAKILENFDWNFWCYKIIKLIIFIWIIFLWIWRRVTRTSYFIKDTLASFFKESVIKEYFLNWFSSVVSDWSILECQFKNLPSNNQRKNLIPTKCPLTDLSVR